MVGQRKSDLSCDKVAFKKAAPEYNQTLQRSGFKHTIMYKPCNPPQTATTRRKRESEILFGSTYFLAKMLKQISEKNFSVYCLNIFPPTTDTTRSSTNKMSS